MYLRETTLLVADWALPKTRIGLWIRNKRLPWVTSFINSSVIFIHEKTDLYPLLWCQIYQELFWGLWQRQTEDVACDSWPRRNNQENFLHVHPRMKHCGIYDQDVSLILKPHPAFSFLNQKWFNCKRIYFIYQTWIDYSWKSIGRNRFKHFR